MGVSRCSSALNGAGTAFMCFKLSKLGFNAINVFPLVNTWHALGFSVFLMVDTLTFFRCHLRPTEIRLNVFYCWNIECSVNAYGQVGMFLRVGF